jgi:hypothetical protein
LIWQFLAAVVLVLAAIFCVMLLQRKGVMALPKHE